MTLVSRLVPVLQAALVLLFALLLMLQWFSFPGQFAHVAREHPEEWGNGSPFGVNSRLTELMQ